MQEGMLAQSSLLKKYISAERRSDWRQKLIPLILHFAVILQLLGQSGCLNMQEQLTPSMIVCLTPFFFSPHSVNCNCVIMLYYSVSPNALWPDLAITHIDV